MQKTALAVIYGQQASSHSAVVRKWLVAYGEIYRQEVTPAMIQLWESLLSDILASLLDWACCEVARTSKFFSRHRARFGRGSKEQPISRLQSKARLSGKTFLITFESTYFQTSD